jgi:putative Holliday junction resolvase
MAGVLAIDLGTKKTGFALTDALRVACRPLGTARHPAGSDALLRHVDDLLAEYDVDTALVGLPLMADGTEGGHAPVVREFLAQLGKRHPSLQLVTWNEHGTTKEAEAQLREAGHDSRASKALRDSWSALVILQDWMLSGEPR